MHRKLKGLTFQVKKTRQERHDWRDCTPHAKQSCPWPYDAAHLRINKLIAKKLFLENIIGFTFCYTLFFIFFCY